MELGKASVTRLLVYTNVFQYWSYRRAGPMLAQLTDRFMRHRQHGNSWKTTDWWSPVLAVACYWNHDERFFTAWLRAKLPVLKYQYLDPSWFPYVLHRSTLPYLLLVLEQKNAEDAVVVGLLPCLRAETGPFRVWVKATWCRLVCSLDV